MSKHSKKRKKRVKQQLIGEHRALVSPPSLPSPSEEDLSKLQKIPVTYQAIDDYYRKLGRAVPFNLRKETFRRIEQITGRPLICYVAKTHNVAPGTPTSIDDSDVTGFGDLVESIKGDTVDVFIVSNGGYPEAAERIVRLLRDRFKEVRFVVPANAFSAATLICFSGDEIIMDEPGTLGPIDPQINGIPARAILRAFETIEERLVKEGPRALAAYMPLIAKYDLHILELCKSAESLSKELAGNWLSYYMLKCEESDPRVNAIVDFFSNFDNQKSHARSIDRRTAKKLGLSIVNVEDIKGLHDLVRSLSNQYEHAFDATPFIKMFENAHGIGWGRQAAELTVQLPVLVPPGSPQPVPKPGSPGRT